MEKNLTALLLAVVMTADIMGNTAAFAAEDQELSSQEAASEDDVSDDKWIPGYKR